MGKDNFLDYEDFRKMAIQEGLSRHAKIDAPDCVREGYSESIIRDIDNKMPALRSTGTKIVDIGCGCDDMAVELVQRVVGKGNELWLLDSAEMLALMPEHDCVHKFPGKFPDEDETFIVEHRGTIDAVLVYSVLQYVCVHDNIFNFIDSALELLAPGGRILLGDIPNRSKRRRFFTSSEGIRRHQKLTGTNGIPVIDFSKIDYGELDDSILFAIMQRYRNGGYETYLLPQNDNLPSAALREDILIVKQN